MKNLILIAVLLLATSGCTLRVTKGAYVHPVAVPVVYQPVVHRSVQVQRTYRPTVRYARTSAPAPVVRTTVRVTNVNVTRVSNRSTVRVRRVARSAPRTAQRSGNKTMIVQPNAGRIQINGPKRAYALAQRGKKP